MPSQPVTFPSADGLTLEGVITLPAGTGPFPGVVMCHPHPQQGGNMQNNVVDGVCKALEAAGIATLRFNFRGVGGSQGEYSGGVGEQDDARGAVAYLSPQVERIGLAGYSFGSRITMALAIEGLVRAAAFIAPTNNTIAEGAELAGFKGPKLFISGTGDHAVDHEELRKFVDDLADPKEFHVVPDIDHFWWGAERLVGETVAGFFKKALTSRPPLAAS